MVYDQRSDLPESVRDNLPAHGQNIYKEAFNSAWQRFSQREHEEREMISHQIAWSAVKNKYEKEGGQWVLKEKIEEKK